jgi:hypothetical protein
MEDLKLFTLHCTLVKNAYLDTEIRISDVAIIWIVVDKEKNAAFTVVMGRLVIKGDAVPAAILSKGVW